MYDGTEVNEHDAFTTMRTGTKRCRDTTKAVEFLVQWEYGRTTWVTLKDMKNSYPVQMDKYAVQRRFSGKPEFSC